MQKLSGLNLNALRVFEAAARTGSFTAAAFELSVSPSAVSKQVALLEDQLGSRLFKRHHRRIELTTVGQQVADAARAAFAILGEGLQIGAGEHPNQLRLICDADFALLWLLPRLPDFEARHAPIRVSVEPIVGLDRPPSGAFDCAVIWGDGAWRGRSFAPLMTNTVFPVAAPDFFAHLNRPPTPADVEGAMLIHDQSTHWWSAFRAVTAATSFNPELGRVYGQTALCLEAAAAGVGVAIGDEVSTGAYLRANRLEVLFDQRLPSPASYYLVRGGVDAQSEVVDIFKTWLERRAAQHTEAWTRFWSAATADAVDHL